MGRARLSSPGFPDCRTWAIPRRPGSAADAAKAEISGRTCQLHLAINGSDSDRNPRPVAAITVKVASVRHRGGTFSPRSLGTPVSQAFVQHSSYRWGSGHRRSFGQQHSQSTVADPASCGHSTADESAMARDGHRKRREHAARISTDRARRAPGDPSDGPGRMRPSRAWADRRRGGALLPEHAACGEVRGTVPSVTQATKTWSHSRHFAACRVDSVHLPQSGRGAPARRSSLQEGGKLATERRT